MPSKKVCDFDLREGGIFHNRLEKLSDGHYICKHCKEIIKGYGLPIKFDIFQMLVTAQANMVDTVMDTYLKSHNPEEIIATHYPLPSIELHHGEHCINSLPAVQVVLEELIPKDEAVKSISEIDKNAIMNIPNAEGRVGSQIVKGMLFETEAAIYFLSDHYINVHRLGYIKRNPNQNDRIEIETPSKKFTYKVEHADLFFLRERFFQKVNNVINHKDNKLIFINNNNQFTVTPGIYDVPKNIRPGEYSVKAIRDAGLHVKDIHGRVTDYYETEDSIILPEGGILEVTGEYQLEWIAGLKKKDKKK
ncbi:hypothetical protein [Bulleidia sp. zg-1006]|uniref:hypothetical protein n=1 Tax=Bulleidia sp. zg-1006 TaxID=2806552 RepID=UPI00193A1C0C|nr:hypothetical protein [Bulleidia sp. zg-1006]QRG86662.1 hypothetical protein JOS54_07420 [Bulleidia sp. zg-1006]